MRRGRVAGSDPDLDIAVIEVDTADIEPVAWPEESAQPAIGRAVLALGNPGGRGPARHARVRVLDRAQLPRPPRPPDRRARSSTRRRCRAAPRAVRCSIPQGQLLGINSVRVDGGLILAIPADDGAARPGRGARPRRGSEAGAARRRDRAAARRPAAAPSGRSARARRRAGPRGRGRTARPTGPGSSAAI